MIYLKKKKFSDRDRRELNLFFSYFTQETPLEEIIDELNEQNFKGHNDIYLVRQYIRNIYLNGPSNVNHSNDKMYV